MSDTILISQNIKAKPEAIYKAYLNEAANMKWNYASEGWTTPHAHIDATAGGKFNIGYKSPDGKNSFNFEGEFVELVPSEKITYKIADGRMVWVKFIAQGDDTLVELVLTIENENSADLQRQGWSAILQHLAEYVENQ